MGEAAGDLPLDHARMQDAAAVVHGDVFVDAHGAAGAVDLDAAEIEDEAVAERRIDLVGFGRRGQFRRRPERRLAQRLIVRRGTVPGDQCAVAATRPNGDRVVGVADGAHLAAGELDLVRRDIELGGGDALELVAQLCRREMRGAADGGGKAARIIARGNRPGVARGVHFSDDADIGRLEPEGVRDDLGEHGAMTLALRHRATCTVTPADRVERHGGGRLRAVLGARPCAARQRRSTVVM